MSANCKIKRRQYETFIFGYLKVTWSRAAFPGTWGVLRNTGYFSGHALRLPLPYWRGTPRKGALLDETSLLFARAP